jgi:hypothetical protein
MSDIEMAGHMIRMSDIKMAGHMIRMSDTEMAGHMIRMSDSEMAGHMIRMSDSEMPQRIISYNSEVSRKAASPKVRRNDIMSNGTKEAGVRNWRTEARDRV